MQILKETGINWHKRTLIRKLYMDQNVKAWLNQDKTRCVKTGRTARKGCCLWLILLNLYCKYLTQEVLKGFGDFKIVGPVSCTVGYADDLVLLAKEERVLQCIEKLTAYRRCYGMKMNVEKTKAINISRQPSTGQIMVEQKQLGNVECFKYVCRTMTNDARCACEIKVQDFHG